MSRARIAYFVVGGLLIAFGLLVLYRFAECGSFDVDCSGSYGDSIYNSLPVAVAGVIIGPAMLYMGYRNRGPYLNPPEGDPSKPKGVRELIGFDNSPAGFLLRLFRGGTKSETPSAANPPATPVTNKPASTSQEVDLEQELQKAKDMLDKGLIDEEEYKTLKAKIINKN